MKKRGLAAIISVLVAASMTAGCGSAGTTAPAAPAAEESSSGETAQEAAPAEEAPAAEGETADSGKIELTDKEITIELWDIATEESRKIPEEAAVAAFERDYPNIHVNQTHIVNDTYKQQLVVAMSSGKAPDVYMHWTGGPMNEYYRSGFCDDIGALYDELNTTPYLDSAISMCTSDDGKMIALPYGGMSGATVFYNKTIFAECGIEEVPQTIEELEKDCEILKEHGYTPFALANGSKWTGSLYYMSLAARYGGTEAVVKAYNKEGSFADEPFVKAGQKIQEWVEKGYFPEGVNSITADSGQDRQLMYQNQCAMLLQLTLTAGNMKKDNEEWYKANVGNFIFPVDTESEKAGIDQTVAVGSAVGTAFSFNCKGDADKLKAAYVLVNKYYTSDEYCRTLLENTGKTAPIEGMDQYIDDPVVKVSWDLFEKADAIQLFYDQYLPASVAEVHKNTMSTLFDLSETPEQVGQKLQDAYVKYLEEN